MRGFFEQKEAKNAKGEIGKKRVGRKDVQTVEFVVMALLKNAFLTGIQAIQQTADTATSTSFLKSRKKGTPFPSSPLRSLRPSVQILLSLLLTSVLLQAEVAPAIIRIPQPSAWTGQRLPVFIDLRAGGSFQGAASFQIPEIPGAVLLKIDGAVVSSEQIEGETHAVQTHEFALFSQRTGTLEIPEIKVRFGARSTFTSPSENVETTLPATSVEIKRPPASEGIGFLITTESLEVSETWDPIPKPSAQVGDVFKRTIVQRAKEMTGMALIPAPSRVTDGIRAYPPKVEILDKTYRGEFLGERRETLTYQISSPGSLTLPEIRYVWWNPKTQQIQSKSLPTITWKVSLPPVPRESKLTSIRYWPWLLTTTIILAIAITQRRRLSEWLVICKTRLNPSDRIATRALLLACRQNDAAAASLAWSQWLATRNKTYQPTPELRAAVTTLQRHLFGPSSPPKWSGNALARAFRSQPTQQYIPITHSALPSLNFSA